MAILPGFDKNFKSYLHLKAETIFYIIIIIAVSLSASIIALGILYDRDIKNKSTDDKSLGLASIITLAVGIVLLIAIIWPAWSSWKNAVIEDDIVSDLTIVAAQKPTLDELQNKIGELVHRKIGKNNIDKGALTNYIFGRPGADGNPMTELTDTSGNLIAARSGLAAYRPRNLAYTAAELAAAKTAARAEGGFDQLSGSRIQNARTNFADFSQ